MNTSLRMSNFTAISWREQVAFRCDDDGDDDGDDDVLMMVMMMVMMMQRCTRLWHSWVLIELAHWINSPQVDMSLHSDTLSWFRANQSLLSVLSGETANTNFIVWFHPTNCGSNPQSTAHMIILIITPSMRLIYKWIRN
jgi:hypothetical protein